MAQCLDIIEGKPGRPVPDRFLEAYPVNCFHLIYRALDQYDLRSSRPMAKMLQPVRGIKDALKAIDLPMYVVSSGGHAKMRTTLGLTGLLD